MPHIKDLEFAKLPGIQGCSRRRNRGGKRRGKKSRNEKKPGNGGCRENPWAQWVTNISKTDGSGMRQAVALEWQWQWRSAGP